MKEHYLIFIHGMGEHKPDENPYASYDELWEMMKAKSKLGKSQFEEKFGRIYTDWHIDPLQSSANTIFDAAFPGLRQQALNPMNGIRGFMTFFLGDVIAYVSEDVNFIRRTVWQKIWQELEQPLKQGAKYSIIAHSLGTAIAFDYLFDLFHPDRQCLFVPMPDAQERPEDRHLQPVVIQAEDITRLQTQFRHFFTFGSPIGLFMMRKGALWMEGQPFTTLFNPVRGDGRSWYNFWDGQDAIAYPLAELFRRNPLNQDCKLVDVPVETGFLMFDSHTRYWNNKKLANQIADIISMYSPTQAR